MKLQSVHVTNFRSAENSEVFTVSDVTCLVGKNEAGKSAILLALAALNPHPATPTTFDKERDYPRRSLTQYKANHPSDEATTVKTTWQLDRAEVEELAETVGAGVCGETVEVSRRYEDSGPRINVNIDFKMALEFLYSKFALDASERSVIGAATTTSELMELLPKLESPTAKHAQLGTYLKERGNATNQVHSLIKQWLPRFMYFSSYDRMEGAVQLESTNQLKASGQLENDAHRGSKLFVEFLEFAGVSIADILSVSTFETFNARLAAASNNITDQVLEYWTQNPDLSVTVNVSQAKPGDAPPLNTGTIARARINNNLHRVDTPFSERSAGFVWFFSFLVKFAQVKNEGSPVILLLDEPGLTLHGKAQAELLRFFKEKLAPFHQVIYSTHSPFMVSPDDFASVRIVEDRVEMKGPRRLPVGTKVRDDVLSRDPDTLFPLQGALGYEITQTLFVGKHTLLVEGPGDILYLQAFSDALKRRNREGLDTRWTICPAGGIDKIKPFVALFAGNELHVAALSDQATGDKKKIEDLKRSAVLRAGHVYTIADFIGRAEGDIEDIFEPETYASILNDTYSLTDAHKVSAKKLADADSTTQRLVKQAEAAFRVMPESIPMFDHFTPASWLIRNPKLLDSKSAPIGAALDRAEKIFSVFNKLL